MKQLPGLTVNDSWLEFDAAPPDCPTRFPRRTARLVAKVVGLYAPGNNSQDSFYLTTNAKRSMWILWAEFESFEEDAKYICRPTAWCSRKGVARSVAAVELLSVTFKAVAESVSGYDCVVERGIVDGDTVMELVRDAWGDE